MKSKKIFIPLVLLLAALLLPSCVGFAAGEAAAEGESVISGFLGDFLASFAPLTDALTGGSAEALLSANMGSTFSLAMLVLVVLGILEACFGYKLLRLELLAGGVAAGFFAGDLLLGTGILDAYLTEAWMPIVLKLILGILLAYIAYKLFRLALFAGVAFLVFTFGRGIVLAFLPNPIAALVVALVAALLVALLALKLLRTVVVLLTAALGAYLVAFALAGLLPFSSAMLIVFGVVFIIGLGAQAGAFSHRR